MNPTSQKQDVILQMPKLTKTKWALALSHERLHCIHCWNRRTRPMHISPYKASSGIRLAPTRRAPWTNQAGGPVVPLHRLGEELLYHANLISCQWGDIVFHHISSERNVVISSRSLKLLNLSMRRRNLHWPETCCLTLLCSWREY